MDRVTIRVAAVADAAVISDLLYEFNGEALSPQALVARMQEVQDLETAFLGELGGAVAGLVVLRTIPTLSDAQDWVEITEMYVRPAFRRRGVGRALVGAAIEYARQRGSTEIHLLVNPANVTARSFYAAVGFHGHSLEMRREL